MAVAQACYVLDVPYTAAIPYPGQELVWPDLETRVLYRSLLTKADTVDYT